jgi:glycosyltransferase involved in cell wall biosynthesis
VLISIVTNSFNQAAYLDTCISSVLSQDYPHVEYIVVDAGSSDGSLEVVERHRNRISRFLPVFDRGPAAALNAAFRCATGEWIGYVNSDDMYLPGALSRVAAFIARHLEADVVYGDGLVIDGEGRVQRQLYSARWDVRGFAYGVLSAVQPATFIRRSAFLRSAGFNAENRTCWDRELLLDLSVLGARFAYLSEPLAAFRIHADSITGSGRLHSLSRQEHARLVRKFIGRAPARTDELRRMYYRFKRRALDPRIVVDDGARAAVLVRRAARRVLMLSA